MAALSCTPMMLFESFCLEVLPSWVSLSVCVLLSLLSFQGLSIICDEWLVPALEVICVSLSIPEDIAGVTFMAFGSAAPEIVINSVSTIKTVVRGGDDGGEGLQSQSEDEAREQVRGGSERSESRGERSESCDVMHALLTLCSAHRRCRPRRTWGSEQY